MITFNWDPFLFDAYQRNRYALRLPEIVLLHGNVRIGACGQHDSWGARNERCSECCQQFTDVPLLYPLTQKNYSSNPYIRSNWDAARSLFSEAFTTTIFGYSAPVADADAVGLLRQAWMERSARTFQHIEIIDIASESLLHERWSPVTPTLDCRVVTAFEQSMISRWPRRSCEALLYPSTHGIPVRTFRFRTPTTFQNSKCTPSISRSGRASSERINRDQNGGVLPSRGAGREFAAGVGVGGGACYRG